jgi:hypothetical protein
MGTTGRAMVTIIVLSLFCYAAQACDLAGYDQAQPPPLKGAVSTPLADFEYASDVDTGPSQGRLWNYVLNKYKDKGIAVAWPKAGIAMGLWLPLAPGESACKKDTVTEIQIDTDAPITYGTTDTVQTAQVYLPEGKKLGSTDSAISTTYLNEEGKSVGVNVRLETSRVGSTLQFAIDHSPGVVVGIAGLPGALTSQQIESLQKSADAQSARVEQATFLEYTKQDPKTLARMFTSESTPNEKTRFLFISGKSAKLGFEAGGAAVQKVRADVVVLEEKSRRLVLATDMSLLVPAK